MGDQCSAIRATQGQEMGLQWNENFSMGPLF